MVARSCFERKYTEILHILHRNVELYFDCPAALHSRNISTFIFSKQIRWTHEFGVLSIEPTENFRY